MNSEELYNLLKSICNNDLDQVIMSCHEKKLNGPFVPSPLNLALRVTSINPKIIQTLLDHGLLPSSEDIAIYHTLSDAVKDTLPKLTKFPLRSSSIFLSSIVDWVQKTSISAKNFVWLYEINFNKKNTHLARYLMSICPTLNTAEKEILLTIAARIGDSELFQTLLLNDLELNPQKTPTQFRTSALYRHPDIVKILLQDGRIDPAINNNEPLCNSITAHRLEVVKLLLTDKRVDPTANNYKAFQEAVRIGNIEIFKVLALNKHHYINLAYNNNLILNTALIDGHFDIVKFLLKNVDVIKTLGPNDYAQIIDIAINKANFDPIKTILKSKHITPSELYSHIPSYHFISQFKQHPEYLKLFLAFATKEERPTLTRIADALPLTPQLMQEITWLHSLVNAETSLQKRLFKQLKSETGITLNTQHYLRCAELLYKAQDKEEFSQELTTLLLKEDIIQPFKTMLTPLIKTFYPLIATAKNALNDSTYDLPTTLPIISVTLFPQVKVNVTKELFKTLQEHLLSSSKGLNSKKAFEDLVNTQAKEIFQTLALRLYQSKDASKSWVQTIQTSPSSRSIG